MAYASVRNDEFRRRSLWERPTARIWKAMGRRRRSTIDRQCRLRRPWGSTRGSPFLFILSQLCVQKRIDVRCVSGDNWRKRSPNTKWTFGLPFDFYSKLTLAPIVLIWPDRHLRWRNPRDFHEKEDQHHKVSITYLIVLKNSLIIASRTRHTDRQFTDIYKRDKIFRTIYLT